MNRACSFIALASLLALAPLGCGDDSSASEGGGGSGAAGATSSSSSSTSTGSTSATNGAGGRGGDGGAGDGGAADGGAGGTGPGAGGGGGTGGFSSYELGLNDVSILFPLDGGMLRATDETGGGELLPLAAFEAVGTIDGVPTGIGGFEPEPVELTWPRLRVVAMRIDPCFLDVGEESCRPMLRMVMQPLNEGDQSFADNALHVFYDLDAATFVDLVNDLAHLAEDASVSTDGPLGVHPVLASEGPDGPFAVALRSTILSHVAVGRLTRVTAMTLVQPGGTWMFHGANFVDGVPTDIGILGTSELSQTINNFGGQGLFATVTPVFAEDSTLSLLWDAEAARAASREGQQEAFDAANAVENPDLFTVEEQGCVSCHTAGPARAWAQRELALEESPNRFDSAFDLSLVLDSGSLEDTTQVRAFGYRGNGPIFSQRAVNESAAVATALNAARAGH